MITIESIKNVSLENIVFPKNSAVLLKYSERANSNGGIDTTVKYVAIDGVKDNADISVVKTLLAALIAEKRVKTAFNNEFSLIKDEKGNLIEENSGITAKSVITPFLTENTVYKTDSNGKLAFALKCESGVKLRDTALKITTKQAVTRLNSSFLRAAIHVQSQAIVKQATYLSSIDKIKNAILKDIAIEKAAKEDKEAKKAA